MNLPTEIPDDDEALRRLSEMSDADLEALMGGGVAANEGDIDVAQIEPGTRLQGTVLEARGDELLVELDGKSLGVVDLSEFDAGEVPSSGDELHAELVRYDAEKEIAILSTSEVRTEVAWEELRVGTLVAGRVTDKNRGGLTLDIKGIRAFLPISQIELSRVEDLDPYVGQTLQCRVTQVDRADQNLVVSRRELLEEEAAAAREEALAKLDVGAVVTGTVVRINDHGAFIDLGGVDGLLHASKIRAAIQEDEDGERVHVGKRIAVEVRTIDRSRARIGLDFHHVEGDSWDRVLANFAVGDLVVGWLSERSAAGARIKIDDGLEAAIPPEELGHLEPDASVGAIVRATIIALDAGAREVRVRPVAT